MIRAVYILLFVASATARAAWSPDFESRLTNSWMDHALFTQLFAAVQERCEATYYGDAVQSNGPNIATRRLYRVDPISITSSPVLLDYTSSPPSVIVSNVVATTNVIPHQVPWEYVEAVFRKIDALIPWYVDTSISPAAWFGTPIGACTIILLGYGLMQCSGWESKNNTPIKISRSRMARRLPLPPDAGTFRRDIGKPRWHKELLLTGV